MSILIRRGIKEIKRANPKAIKNPKNLFLVILFENLIMLLPVEDPKNNEKDRIEIKKIKSTILKRFIGIFYFPNRLLKKFFTFSSNGVLGFSVGDFGFPLNKLFQKFFIFSPNDIFGVSGVVVIGVGST